MLPCQREASGQPHAASWKIHHMELALQAENALAHAGKTSSPQTYGLARGALNTAAIILDRDVQAFPVRADVDSDQVRMAMAHGVADTFLHDAVGGFLLPPLGRYRQLDVELEADGGIAPGQKPARSRTAASNPNSS